ncbi:MAG: sulfite exporter TauE/SafE family protein [Polyangiaceae bacterium]
MIVATLASAWVMGTVGSAHCAAMCGGAASTISGSVVQLGRRPRVSPAITSLAYNTGRVTSYAIAGVIVGTIGTVIDRVPFIFGAEVALRIAAGALLCAVGLYLTGFWQRGAAFERIGLPLWRRIEPFARRFVPIRSVWSALALGMLWGWIPCGLVYAALGVALASGSSLLGGLSMLAFGVGTLPARLLMGAFGARMGKYTRHALVRRVAGLTIILFGLFHIASASAQAFAPPAAKHACCTTHQRA